MTASPAAVWAVPRPVRSSGRRTLPFPPSETSSSSHILRVRRNAGRKTARVEVPAGFRIRNSSEALLASHPDGAVVRFDGGRIERRMTMKRYLTREWLRGLELGQIEDITVNRLDAATGTTRVNTRDGLYDIRAVAIRFDRRQVYRFLIITRPRLTGPMGDGLRRMTFSFRPLSRREIADLKPLRLGVREVRRRENVESLAATLPFDDFHVERFRVLNGLGPRERLKPRQLVKVIGD